MLNHTQLKAILPQAYPFLLIDRVEEVKPFESLVAIKNITSDEWCCQNEADLSNGAVPPLAGRPTGRGPYFPETLLIEAAAQAALVLYHVSKVKEGQKVRYFLGRVKVEFLKPVIVGEQLRIQIICRKIFDTGGYAEAKVLTSDLCAGEMELLFKVEGIVDKFI